MNIFKLLFGSQNERAINKILPLINKVNAIEEEIHLLRDEKLKGKTVEFRQRLANGESLDSLLPEAFAVVREASQRTLGMRHFDVQLIGGVVLHQGKIAEMKTGEGKTLCATLPAYLNALSGDGVHVVTVNDYLARRDAEWMGQIYKYLGLSVGTIVGGSSYEDRRGAYSSDITYGQNNEFGFDYLRDNMKLEASEMVQAKHNFAIVDEVDSILIDEARTPLIISGASKGLRDQYLEADRIVRVLRPEQHFTEDLKARQVTLTEDGVAHVETMLKIENLYDPSNIERVHHITQALKARVVMKRDIDYVVRDNQVIIVDEFTGRLMAGRRWSDGLHQAVEAKEGVPIAAESQTLATITFQNFFRMYKKLAGMTGTADTEAVEFRKIYNLEVMMIPTNKPMLRKDYPDVVFSGRQGKFKAVIEEIKEMYNNGQPVLVGTTNIEQSEVFSALLVKEGIPHNVLNAKQHEREAEIVAQAGRYKAVTISTNMAGRGTDIILGGNPEFLAAAELRSREGEDVDPRALVESFRAQCATEREQVLSAGGLHILGTERHESRRIDNQLRGRSGRQGDPGSSRFYVSLEDDLMRRFGGDRMQSMMARVGMTEDDAIEGTLVARAIEGAQKKVEAMHFDMRKHLLEYDDVMNKQREIIYGLRQRIIETQEMEDDFNEVIIDVLENIVLSNADERSRPSEWDFESMVKSFNSLVGAEFVVSHFIADVARADKESGQRIYDQFKEYAFQLRQKRQAKFGKEVLGKFERWSYLMSIDFHWKEHLVNIEHLKEGIGLRGYAQQNPLYEYQREALELFKATMWSIRYTVVQNSFRQEFLTQEEVDEREREAIEAQRTRERAAQAIHQEIQREAQTTAAAQSRVERRQQESHRNTPRQVSVGVVQHKKDEARERNRLARKARKASRK